MDTKPDNTIYVIYDGLCPFCRNYCQRIRIQDTGAPLTLIDARRPSKIMDDITAKGLDIDNGMVVKIGTTLHYGADAIHTLALLSTKFGAFNRATYWLFKSPKTAATLYPMLRDARNIALKIMRIPLINNLNK